MKFIETKLPGAFIIELEKFEDSRGFFARSWCKMEFEKYGLNTNVVQANVSSSNKKGTLRGLHYQVAPYQEAKYLKCTCGALFDVIIDLRKRSPTFMQWTGVILTSSNYRMLYVPEDFCHGFITLEDQTEIQYMVTQYYTPEAEKGIRWDDPSFQIEWPVQPSIISDKDNAYPNFMSE